MICLSEPDSSTKVNERMWCKIFCVLNVYNAAMVYSNWIKARFWNLQLLKAKIDYLLSE